jgi:hypothetical protein
MRTELTQKSTRRIERTRSLPNASVTPAQFRKRATHYRLAAAVTDNPKDVEAFCDLANMFDRIAIDFDRIIMA